MKLVDVERKQRQLNATFATYDPCLTIVRSMGYKVSVTCYRKPDGSDPCLYSASRDEIELSASSGPELLGLLVMWERFGEDWRRHNEGIIAEVITEEDDY